MEERKSQPTEGSQTLPKLGVRAASGGRGLELPWCLLLTPADVVRSGLSVREQGFSLRMSRQVQCPNHMN